MVAGATITLASFGATLIACEPLEEATNNGNSNSNNNANSNNNGGSCPATLPTAEVTCTVPSCQPSMGTRTVGFATLDPAVADRWLVIASAASNDLPEAEESIDLTYTRETVGGLSALVSRSDAAVDLDARRAQVLQTLRQRWGPDTYERILGDRRQRRIASEARLRARRPKGPMALTGREGTAIRADGPTDVLAQQASCSRAAPSCGTTALCIIPEGSDVGSCQGEDLIIKFRDIEEPGTVESVTADVWAVGTYGAIVIDDDYSATRPQAEVAEIANELLDRFDNQIAPLDHAFFGLPRDEQGRDYDGNGVVILFLTPRVATEETGLLGFFDSTDLQLASEVPNSNAADILYLNPPGGDISLDDLSGTIGHEYQHIIYYYAKVINGGSTPDDVWLDEGMSTFAEDMLGYGQDAFKNIAAYLPVVSDTSLTGLGLTAIDPNEGDSIERRAAAHLLVRYYFEQNGGARFSTVNRGEFVDDGGVSAVRDLVARSETGITAFEGTGRTFSQWVQDLLTTVAIDGRDIPDVTCNPRFTFGDPEIDAFTGIQRGIDLQQNIILPGGETIPLDGPGLVDLQNESVPVPINGGEIRFIETSQTTRIGLTGSAADLIDFLEFGLRVVPWPR